MPLNSITTDHAILQDESEPHQAGTAHHYRRWDDHHDLEGHPDSASMALQDEAREQNEVSMEVVFRDEKGADQYTVSRTTMPAKAVFERRTLVRAQLARYYKAIGCTFISAQILVGDKVMA